MLCEIQTCLCINTIKAEGKITQDFVKPVQVKNKKIKLQKNLIKEKFPQMETDQVKYHFKLLNLVIEKN